MAGDELTNRSSRHHHGSHRDLLTTAYGVATSKSIDAIIVPTGRNARSMLHAITLAARLNCTLVALCSHYSKAAMVEALARRCGTELIAIDVGKFPSHLLPGFETCDLLRDTKFERRTDTSAKRNLGLLIARMTGWQRIMFLDDDIVIPIPTDLCEAAALAGLYAGVGLSVTGFPDNSVVCHAYREAGGRQDMFIGGGALVVGSNSILSSFFPNIYNEDWFFLLGENKLRPSAVTGTAVQKPYDPFAREERARAEELGDCLAEGLFWLLDEGRPLADADALYWKHWLFKRASFINEVIDMANGMDCDSARRSRMLNSLKAARGRCLSIEPQLCEDYVLAWRRDRDAWRKHLQDHKPKRDSGFKGNPMKVVAELGLSLQTKYLPRKPLDHDATPLDPSMTVAVAE